MQPSGAPTPRLAVQQAIEAQLDMPVSLRVDTLNTFEDWVFLAGVPLTPENKRIDYTQTKFAHDVAEGYFDDNFTALARQDELPGEGWRVVELAIGSTDAPFVGWFERYGLPMRLGAADSDKH